MTIVWSEGKDVLVLRYNIRRRQVAALQACDCSQYLASHEVSPQYFGSSVYQHDHIVSVPGLWYVGRTQRYDFAFASIAASICSIMASSCVNHVELW